MAQIPFAPQFGVTFTLNAPYSYQATFNDPTLSNHVGMLQNASGLDSADVRDSYDDFVNMDGGIHGPFFYTRRAIVLEGMIENPLDATDRNTRLNRLMRASASLTRQDGSLVWTPTGGTAVLINVRKNGRLQVDGAWAKSFQLPLVAADPRIYTFARKAPTVSPSGTTVMENQGTVLTYPTLTITGPITNPVVTNTTTGEAISFTGTISSGTNIVVNMLARTVFQGSTVKYSLLNYASSTWWGLQPGNNSISLTQSSSSAPAGLTVTYRDAWL